jgi:hypothetical protein
VRLPKRVSIKRPDTIRVRLALALAIAMLPVLVVGGLQADIAFQHQAQEERVNLAAAAKGALSDSPTSRLESPATKT